MRANRSCHGLIGTGVAGPATRTTDGSLSPGTLGSSVNATLVPDPGSQLSVPWLAYSGSGLAPS